MKRMAANPSVLWMFVGLLSVGLLRVVPSLYAESRTATTTLSLRVAEEGLLELQNDTAIVKIRLAPGVTGTLWGDMDCTTPASVSYVITVSGTYTVPLNEIPQGQNGGGAGTNSVCLQTSDGVLHRSVPAKGQ